MNTRCLLHLFAAFALLLHSAPLGYGKPGDLDPTFGTSGRVLAPVGTAEDSGRAVAVQADGKILVAGFSSNGVNHDFSLARYTAAGAADGTFGTSGTVLTELGSEEQAYGITVQADGKILVAGSTHNGNDFDFALVRYTAAGALDSTFGAGGKVITDFGASHDLAVAVTVQADGKIVVGGYTKIGGTFDFAAARYDTSGTLDPTFGTGGKAVALGGADDYATSMVVQPDGKIVVAGYAYEDSTFVMAVMRFTAAGTLDAGFGSGGKATKLIGTVTSYANHVALQPDGKIVLAGYEGTGTKNAAALLRFTPAGVLDSSFGTGGVVITESPIGLAEANGVAVQPNGKIVVAGTIYDLAAHHSDISVTRYTPSGDLDGSFGAGGQVVLDYGADTFGYALALPADGKLVVAGSGFVPTNNDFCVVRLAGESPGDLDPSFGTGGEVVTGGSLIEARGVKVQADGKVVVAGSSLNGSFDRDYTVARYDASGALDPSFGIGGISTTNPAGGLDEETHGVAIQSDGKIVLAGESYKLGNRTFAAARFNPDGTPDPAFGTGGSVTTSFSPYMNDSAAAVAVQADGKIILAGYSDDDNDTRFGLVRYTANGALDPSFGTAGKLRLAQPDFTGEAYAIVVQGDGKLVVGGRSLGTFALARLNPDGTPDTSFDSDGGVLTIIPGSAGSRIFGLALQPDGKIVAAGFVLRSGNEDIALARYATDGTLDTTFGTNGLIVTDLASPADRAQDLVVLRSGKIIVAGATYDGFSRNFAILRYLGNGAPDTTFGTSGVVTTDFGTGDDIAYSVALQRDGKAVAVGSRNGQGFAIARYLGDPDLTTEIPTLTSASSVAYQGRTMSVQFTLPEPALANSVQLTFDDGSAQTVFTLKSPDFETEGPHALTFNPDSPLASGFFSSATALADGTYTVTLSYQDAAGNGASASAGIMNVGVSSAPPPGSVDSLVADVTGSYVIASAQQPDGKTILIGLFDHVNGVARNNIARLLADGTVDPTFDPNVNGRINAVAVLPNGKIVIGGFFTSLQPNGAPAPTSRTYLARLNADGTLDASLDLPTDLPVLGLAAQPDGRLLFWGYFNSVQGYMHRGIARLKADGTLDAAFNPNPLNPADPGSDYVFAAAVQGDGKILLGGNFTSLDPNAAGNPIARLNLARVNDDGTVDMGFDPSPNFRLFALRVQPDGKVLLCGDFNALAPNGGASITRNRIARVNVDGTLDMGFNPDVNGEVNSMALQIDGQVLFTGGFTTVQGIARNYVARVAADGTLDANFDPNLNGGALSVALQGDGQVQLGGAFTSLQPAGAAAPSPRSFFARLVNDSISQTLTVPDATQVQWQRGGAAPELAGVVFEKSYDHGATWTSLGRGTRVGTTPNWQITGIDLSGQFGQLRALGFTTGGYFNGSSGLVEQTVSFDFGTSTSGNSTYLGNTIIANRNVLNGRYVTVTEPSVLVSFGGIFGSSGPQANIALYKIDGDFDRPGTRLSQTGAFTVTGGVNEVPAIGTPVIEPGTYFLIFVFSDFTILGGDTSVFINGLFRNPFPFTGDLPSFLNEGNLSNQLRPVNIYLRLGPVSPAPTLAKPASNSFASTQVDVDFTLPQAALNNSLTLTFTGPVVRTFTLADTLGTAARHTFSFAPADPLGTSGGAIASASMNDLPDGYYSVTLSYQNLNGAGPGISVSSNVLVDHVAPTLTVSSPISIQGNAPGGAIVDFAASLSATDNLDSSVSIVAVPASGSTFALGTTTVNVIATDDAGNEKTGSFTVTVTDTTPPVFVAPTPTGTLSFDADPGNASKAVTFTLAATDLVDTTPTIVLTAGLPSGSSFPIGFTTVAARVTDDSGNFATTSFVVEVRDVTAPTLDPPNGGFSPLTVYAGSTLTNYADFAVATDASSVAKTQVPPAGTVLNTVGTTHITITATDSSENSTSLGLDVTVRPAEAQNRVTLAKGRPAPGAGGVSGVPGDATMTSFSTPAIDDAGHLAFVGKYTSTSGKGTALFTDTACLARVGGNASGASPGIYKSFSDPVIDSGEVVTVAGMSGVPAASATAVLHFNASGVSSLVARTGDIAPDQDGTIPILGAKFKSFKGISLRSGAVAIFAQLTGGTGPEKSSPATDYGLWIKDGSNPLKLVFREGKSTVEMAQDDARTLKTLVTFATGNGSPGQGRGWLTQAYGPTATALLTFTDKSQAVVIGFAGGSAQLLSLTGTSGNTGPAIPNVPTATFASYSFPASIDDYSAAFLASLTPSGSDITKANARGVFVTGPNGAIPLARLGADSGINNGAKFSVLKDPVYARDHSVAFPATLKGGTVKGLGATTLWWRHGNDGDLTLLAQAGTAGGVPNDLPEGAQWKSFPSLAIADNRGPLVSATLVPNKGGVKAADASGVWAMDFTGRLRTLFRTGKTFDLGNGITRTVKSFTLLNATIGSKGVTRSFNAKQQVVWLATFKEDKSQAIITTDVP